MTIELEGIQKSFGRKKVLENVSLTVSEGSCVGIVGGNGCGKSTLLSVLAGVQKAEEGSFCYRGVDLWKDRALAVKIVGYVPQENSLLEELTAWDNLRMWYDRETLKRELSGGVLAVLGIDSFLKMPVNRMSGGMKKRLSIGCAVAGGAQILLLDEPSAALDLVCKEQIYNYFKQFQAEGGTVFLATHEIQEVELCDQCCILKQGSLKAYEYDGNLHHLVGNL